MKKKQTEQKPAATEPQKSITIEGDSLVIRMPILEKPRAAASGKNIIVASSGGNVRAAVKYKGRDLFFQASAWVEPEVL